MSPGAGPATGRPGPRPPSLPALPAPRDPGGPYRICCVCWGNICRSPMAEALLRSRLAAAGISGTDPDDQGGPPRVVVDSAGTSDEEAGRAEHPSTRRLLTRHGLSLERHQARRFEPSWIGRYDLLLAMDRVHERILRGYAERAGAAGGAVSPDRVRLVTPDGIADPWGHPDAAYEDVFQALDGAFDTLVPELRRLLVPTPTAR